MLSVTAHVPSRPVTHHPVACSYRERAPRRDRRIWGAASYKARRRARHWGAKQVSGPVCLPCTANGLPEAPGAASSPAGDQGGGLRAPRLAPSLAGLHGRAGRDAKAGTSPLQAPATLRGSQATGPAGWHQRPAKIWPTVSSESIGGRRRGWCPASAPGLLGSGVSTDSGLRHGAASSAPGPGLRVSQDCSCGSILYKPKPTRPARDSPLPARRRDGTVPPVCFNPPLPGSIAPCPSTPAAARAAQG